MKVEEASALVIWLSMEGTDILRVLWREVANSMCVARPYHACQRWQQRGHEWKGSKTGQGGEWKVAGGVGSSGDGTYQILPPVFAISPPLSSPQTCTSYRAGTRTKRPIVEQEAYGEVRGNNSSFSSKVSEYVPL